MTQQELIKKMNAECRTWYEVHLKSPSDELQSVLFRAHDDTHARQVAVALGLSHGKLQRKHKRTYTDAVERQRK